jgi:hypothetical protein
MKADISSADCTRASIAVWRNLADSHLPPGDALGALLSRLA